MSNLTMALKALPRDVQSKIYILMMRRFWRSYVPLTAQVPSWREHQIAVDHEIWESKDKNIHFLHLSFNCLPENKRWIMGCQCSHCLEPKSVSKIVKRRELSLQDNHPVRFLNRMPEHDDLFNWDLGEYGYDQMDMFQPMNMPGLKENLHYDPLRNSAYEDSSRWSMRRPAVPMKFDEDIVEDTYAILHMETLGV